MQASFLPASMLALFLTVTAARADVVDTSTERQLSLPAAAIKLSLPRGDWVILSEQRRTGDTAVYYALASEQRKMLFSVYIDKTTICQAASACRELAMKNPSYKDAIELKTFELDKFSVSQFFLQPPGAPMKQANVVASAYVDGFWFDIHISKGGDERTDPASLLEMLKEVSIK